MLSVSFDTTSISTHTLTWSVTNISEEQYRYIRISTHTLTWSVTRGAMTIHEVKKFQLTRSRGAWPPAVCKGCLKCHFNSHAHVERDKNYSYINHKFKISTHTLTWSVTSEFWKYMRKISISTHTLTWSVTRARAISCTESEISTHTLTWSVTHFISYLIKIRVISTHTLTWSVTCWHCRRCVSQLAFQLTRSRGAWQFNQPYFLG